MFNRVGSSEAIRKEGKRLYAKRSTCAVEELQGYPIVTVQCSVLLTCTYLQKRKQTRKFYKKKFNIPNGKHLPDIITLMM